MGPHVYLNATLTAGDPGWYESGTLFGDVDPGPAQEGPTHADVTDPELTGLRGPLQFTEKVRG
jgi:hypothetical protein